MIRRDSQDQPIEVGDLVAYNQSGDVVPGIVEYVPQGGYGVGAFTIAHADLDGYVKFTAKTSRVRNSRSIMVLKKAKDLTP